MQNRRNYLCPSYIHSQQSQESQFTDIKPQILNKQTPTDPVVKTDWCQPLHGEKDVRKLLTPKS